MKIVHCSREYSEKELKLIKKIQVIAVRNPKRIGSISVRNGKIAVFDLDGEELPSRHAFALLQSSLVEKLVEAGLDKFDFTAINNGLVYE